MLRSAAASAASLMLLVPASLTPGLLAACEHCLLQQPTKLATALQGGLKPLLLHSRYWHSARTSQAQDNALCCHAGTGKRIASVKVKQQRQQRIFQGRQTKLKPRQSASVYSLGSGAKNPITTHLKRSPNLLLR